ncbi:hypothetical protein NC651_026268 [Populus alba x Populus x berolinensis]|nr:hypothetical protein NC651_026268 [Populus alba x Populus x berolinensis]
MATAHSSRTLAMSFFYFIAAGSVSFYLKECGIFATTLQLVTTKIMSELHVSDSLSFCNRDSRTEYERACFFHRETVGKAQQPFRVVWTL